MQFVLRFLLYLAAVALGAAGVTVAVAPDIGIEMAQNAQARLDDPSGRIAVGLIGVVLVMIPLAMLLRWYASRRYAREVSYVTEAGRVAVSLIAIEEALTRAVEQESEVRKVQVRVYEDRVRRAIVCEAALTLWDDGDVSGVNFRCQQIMRSRFGELLPDQTAVQVHLTVHRLSHRRPDSEPDSERPQRERATRETADQDMLAEDITPTRVPLPGLTTTHGEVDNQAGAELLRQRRESRGTTIIAAEVGDQPAAPEQQAAEVAAQEEAVDDDDEGLYDDLYVGPNYPVDDDEDDSGVQAKG